MSRLLCSRPVPFTSDKASFHPLGCIWKALQVLALQSSSIILLNTCAPKSDQHLCPASTTASAASTIFSGLASMPEEGATDPVQGSQYTCRSAHLSHASLSS
ncbi:hypothetical protein WJX82_009842 [Trebouxia sp. C0006]